MPAPGHATQLLVHSTAGDAAALNKLIPLVYAELRRIAARVLRQERPDHSLNTTALVHEAYLRLVDQRQVRWQERSHFFGVAAQMMRRVLVDHARRRAAAKRGGAQGRVDLKDQAMVSGAGTFDLIALDEALCQLATFDPRQSQIVEVRFFGGLTIEATAEALRISPATVKREWVAAKTWLRRQVCGSETNRRGS